MGWLDRIRPSTGGQSEDGPDATEPAVVERRSPALAVMFEAIRPDRSHSFLDFGPAANGHLRLLAPYARQIRFAGLVPSPPGGEPWSRAASRDLPPNIDYPYDVVLAWDALDRMEPGDRRSLIDRLVEVTAPGARLYAVVDASGATARAPIRSELVSLDRVSEEIVGPPEPTYPPLLPAQVEKLLDPFTIQHAYTLRSGHREYVALKSWP